MKNVFFSFANIKKCHKAGESSTLRHAVLHLSARPDKKMYVLINQKITLAIFFVRYLTNALNSFFFSIPRHHKDYQSKTNRSKFESNISLALQIRGRTNRPTEAEVGLMREAVESRDESGGAARGGRLENRQLAAFARSHRGQDQGVAGRCEL